MKRKYRIEKKGVQLFTQLEYDSFEKVLRDIKNLDILPPFKILDTNSNADATNEFLEYAKKKEYIFIDKEKILSLLPTKFVSVLSKKSDTLFFSYKGENVKLSNKFYIKKVEGFFYLFNYNYIAFGYLKNFILFIDTNDKKYSIYKIDYENYRKLENKILLSDSFSCFLDTLEPLKK